MSSEPDAEGQRAGDAATPEAASQDAVEQWPDSAGSAAAQGPAGAAAQDGAEQGPAGAAAQDGAAPGPGTAAAQAPDASVPGGPLTHKHEVHIYEHSGTPKIDDDTRNALGLSGMMPGGKINIKGVSAKMLRRMRREYVDCPVLGRDVQFLTCFVCPNFQSRVRGKVLCIGNPIELPRPPQG